MKYFKNDKVVIRIGGGLLKYGDISVIKKVDLSSDKRYYCFCALRNIGEWFCESHLDKVKDKNTSKTSSIVRRKEPIEIKPIERPAASYNNLPIYNYKK